jgi:O-antigen ligase
MKSPSSLLRKRASAGIIASLVRDFGDRQQLLGNLLIGYIIFVFLVGGASRADVLSLPLLRTVAVLVCGVALVTLTRATIRENRFLLGMATAMFALAGLHLLPLPPALWQALPGREIVMAVDSYAGLGDVWRPLTMAPTAGWNALFALFVPLAALLLAIQLNRPAQERLIWPLIGVGMASAVLGIFQASGDPNGAAYLYRITNNGSAVGLFANRNHQAFFLLTMFPLLAAWASWPARSDDVRKLRLFGSAIAALMVVPLLMVTGSRAGAVLLIPVLFAAMWLYSRPETLTMRKRTKQRDYVMPVAVVMGLGLLAAVLGLASRAESVRRLFGAGEGDDERFESWPVIVDIIGDYLPFGSGSGSFVETYLLYEPSALIKSTYLNHAHNDWLEVVMTLGLPGAALLLVALLAYSLAALRIIRHTDKHRTAGRLGRAGIVIVGLLGLASIPDYPLRVPSLACLFVVAAVWMRSALLVRSENTGNGLAD